MPPATYRTVATAFDPRNNSLNALRLFFASLVLVDHASIIGGFRSGDALIGGLSLGRWSVAAFFAISGFLITGAGSGRSSPRSSGAGCSGFSRGSGPASS